MRGEIKSHRLKANSEYSASQVSIALDILVPLFRKAYPNKCLDSSVKVI